MTSKIKNKRFSGNLSLDYELFVEAFPHYEILQRKIISSIDRKVDDVFNVLEVGVGPGITTNYFFNYFKNAKILCVDNEIDMVMQSKKNLLNFKHRVEIIYMDALTFLKSLESCSIDVFFSGFTLHNFDKNYRHEFLKEVYRVLSTCGQFVNGDKYALDDVSMRVEAFNWSIGRFLKVFGSYGKNSLCYDWIVHYGEDEKLNRIMIQSEAIEEMRLIGFKDLKLIYREKMEAIISAKK
jgi:ubiquinone/menaquinone biosynthesis C-methylase UbiE